MLRIKDNVWTIISNIPEILNDLPKNTTFGEIKWTSEFKISHRIIGGFEKDNIYSVAFAKSVGVVVNGFTLKCTTQKHSFQVIEKQDIETPIINIQDLQPQEELQDTQYRFEISGYKQKDGSAFRKNSIYTETEIKEAGLSIEELFEKEAITWLK